MKTINPIFLLMFAAVVLFAACSSELKDPSELPGEPVLFGAHGNGYGIFTADNFHGKDIRNRLGWDISSCRTCHGPDYAGGLTGQSCNASGCHAAADGGPEACYLCHGDSQTKKAYPQWYNAHKLHLEGGTLSAVTIACSDCHEMPANFSDPIHIDKTTPGQAEVMFTNAFAAIQTKGTTGTPTYDATAGTCANTYCHGNFPNGNNASVAWKGADQAKCGSCHGDPATGNPLPKAPHPASTNCTGCHAAAYDNGVLRPDKHINGKLDVFGQERTDW